MTYLHKNNTISVDLLSTSDVSSLAVAVPTTLADRKRAKSDGI